MSEDLFVTRWAALEAERDGLPRLRPAPIVPGPGKAGG
jgi:hypothetical protein